MADISKDYSPVIAEINHVVSTTMEDVRKLEGDIRKIEARGRIQFNYNPPGMSDDITQTAKDKAKLENNIGLFKQHAMSKVEVLLMKLPQEVQEKVRKEAEEKLYPERFEKEKNIDAKDGKSNLDNRLGLLSFNTDKRLTEIFERQGQAVPVSRFVKADKALEQAGIEKTEVVPNGEQKQQKSRFVDLLGFNSDRQLEKISTVRDKADDKDER